MAGSPTSGTPTTGKGRPTPKRTAARQARAATTRTSTSAPAATSKAARKAKVAALRSGDERSLPASLRTPERTLVRHVVDTRFSLGWLALPGLGLNLASFVVGDTRAKSFLAAAGFACFVMLVVDALTVTLLVNRAVVRTFPDGPSERVRTLVFYGVTRNVQLRRSRIPAPPKRRLRPDPD